MYKDNIYDCAVIGGGLAGLTLSIQLATYGHAVILFEKEQYPFHKVCGEYISLESWDFLERIGLPLSNMNVPVIKKLLVTAPNGNSLSLDLPLGGFGISRYEIDNRLKKIAVQAGVTVIENCRVDDVVFENEQFSVYTSTGTVTCKTCCGSFGKRSNLDIKWKRPFVTNTGNKLHNHVAVKYHIKTSFPADTIALHNFKDGYCGISRIEDERYCLCYLTNAANLRRSNNSIAEMENSILSRNPVLKNILENSTRLYAQPLSISQVSFQQKSQVENHVLLTGDAAGMITPLCGNGMSMAMHGSKIAAGLINDFLQGKINRQQLEGQYRKAWKKEFGSRIMTGRIIQRFFGKTWVTNLFIAFMKRTPVFTRWLIRKTHGDSF